jgi:SAM-dependent methyltransferase
MTPEHWDAFFQIHSDLPREGPGEDADVAWATQVAKVGQSARIADLGCGPGGDIAALRRAAPQGSVWACDTHERFVQQAKARYAHDTDVTVAVADMSAPFGMFDFIWCAGAAYFLGIDAALSTWRKHLSPGGAIAFSEPCYFTDTPSDAARAFWDGEGVPLSTQAGILGQIARAGYQTLAIRNLSDQAWENYYTPLEAHISDLRSEASPLLVEVIKDTQDEMNAWRACKDETGYLLCVVRPK